MNDHEAILKKVGRALIVVGLIDIAFMLYCITNEISYSSSFNIFAVIAGIFLYRGGLQTAKIVNFFSAFFLTGMGGFIFIFPLFIPPDLLLTQIRLNPLNSAGYFLFSIIVFLLLSWILKSLTSQVIYDAMLKRNINPKSFLFRPRSGVICSLILLATLAVTMPLFLKGETAQIAKTEAQKQVGMGYKFSVSTINISSNHKGRTNVHAVVTAYNRDEIIKIAVQFEK